MAIRRHNLTGIPWYDHDKDQLLEKIKWSFTHRIGPKMLPGDTGLDKKLNNLLGIVSPHAGYSCSGPHASHGYLEISAHDDIESVIILGTNHTGMGSPTSLFPKGEWQTPLGSLLIDEDLHDQFTQLASGLNTNIGFSVETSAHIEEHSIDNQLPFLQYSIRKEFKILPITMGDHSLTTCLAIADIIAKIKSSMKNKLVIVASSDFTHYLSPLEAEKKDRQVLKYLLDFDLKTAVKTQKNLHASICGFGPVVTLFALGRELEMTKAQLLAYVRAGSSADIQAGRTS